jgi:hypothetical protein
MCITEPLKYLMMFLSCLWKVGHAYKILVGKLEERR